MDAVLSAQLMAVTAVLQTGITGGLKKRTGTLNV